MKNERLNGGSSCNTFVVDDTLLKRYNGNDEILRLPGFIYGIGNNAFEGNKTLKRVNLSSNVITIGNSAFDGCELLEEINLPYKLKVIGECAFNGCTALTGIIFNGTKECWFSVKKGEHWLDDIPDFIISCKDGNITKQEEIENESEPAHNFKLSNVKAYLQLQSGCSSKKNETVQDNNLDEDTTILDMTDWSLNRQAYLERRRIELIERMQRETIDDEDDEDDGN